MNKELGIILNVIKRLRFIDATMPIQVAHAFVEVCLNDGILVSDLAKRLSMAVSSASRGSDTLEQLGLVRKERGMNESQKPVTLTPRGKEFASQLISLVVEGQRRG